MGTSNMGAPKGNLNHLQGGQRSKQLRVPLGELPSKLRRVTQAVRRYRRQLEAATVVTHREITDTFAHAIDEAATCEQTAAVARWLLRNKLDSMSVGDVLSTLREIRQAKQQRNRAVASLSLDPAGNVFDSLYGSVRVLDEPLGDDPGVSTAKSPGEPVQQPKPTDEPTAGQHERLETGEKMAPSIDRLTR